VPPMSMPIKGAFFFNFSSLLTNVLPFVAGGGRGKRCGPRPAAEDRDLHPRRGARRVVRGGRLREG
jgi:hypothetical protein